MATHTVCSFDKFGYCKHKDHCRKSHVKELGEKIARDVSNCIYRHPEVSTVTETLENANLTRAYI